MLRGCRSFIDTMKWQHGVIFSTFAATVSLLFFKKVLELELPQTAQKDCKTKSKNVIAKFNSTILQTYSQSVYLFDLFSSPRLSISYSYHWRHTSVHKRQLQYWHVRIPWLNFSSEARVNPKLHNPHEVPRKRFVWLWIDQFSPRLLSWLLRVQCKFLDTE